ncbi:LuxR C-terminal-related transcriptional regulator [Cupriavidus yeoncheonensis]|nr:LuxR C-terminal-related transcriptional regulator [Cupriavidus yeoncheonensis]
MHKGSHPASVPTGTGATGQRRPRRQRAVDEMRPVEAPAPPPPPLPSSPFLLATKIVPPRMPQGLIERPRLLACLAQGSERRLTVIKAPAGFGKTSLAVAWLAQLQAEGARTAWLSVDEDDDEPARFVNHLTESLRLACGDIGASALSLTIDASLVPPRTVVAMLINELAQVDRHLYLFLDDYHLISVADIHDAVALLLQHGPPNLHIVLGTREDPPLPLARLRARNELLEVDASMLRFSFDETQRFLERECEAGLPYASVNQLHSATEGWAAALRLSATMLTRGDPRAGRSMEAPSGTSRPIAAYLEDMLACEPAELVGFMLRTSILDRLCAPLCLAVTGAGNSQALLDTLAARQLLLEPLDLEGRWFRYHQLLRDYLHQRLAAHAGSDVAELHRRAYRWYASEALWTDAVRHALAAGDKAAAVAMIGECAMALVRKGDLLTLLGWQRQLPAEILRGQAEVRLALARGMALALRFQEALAMLDTLEHDAADGALPDPDHCLWECKAIRAVMTALQDDPPGALRQAEACLAHPVGAVGVDTWTLNALTNIVRFGHWKAGRLAELYATPWIPYPVEDDPRNLFTTVYRSCLLGLAELQQMHFTLAERHFVQAMRMAEQNAGPQSPAAALCAPLLAQLRYEHDEIDAAEALLLERAPVINAVVLLDSVLVAHTLLVRIAAARGQIEQGHYWVDVALSIGHQRAWHRLIAAALLERIRLLLAEARTKEAAACVAQLDELAHASATSGRASASEIDRYRVLGTAGLAMAQQRAADAIPLLDSLLVRFPQGRPDYLALRARTMVALACLAAGDPARATMECREVLAAVESSGAYRTILDQGPGIGALLRTVRESTPASEENRGRLACIDQLLERCNARYSLREKPPSPPSPPPTPQQEALSVRERGILDLIAAGQSNKEIARTLGIGPETVKTHVKSIFVKLSVDKRAQAVARAQTLGLVAGHGSSMAVAGK